MLATMLQMAHGRQQAGLIWFFWASASEAGLKIETADTYVTLTYIQYSYLAS